MCGRGGCVEAGVLDEGGRADGWEAGTGWRGKALC